MPADLIHANGAPLNANGEAHRCSVLVVEDDPGLGEVLGVALEGDGYDVATVANGRDALERLHRTANTCLIVLDLDVPVMNGREFRIAQLRDRSLAWIPIVVVSGGTEGVREALDLGARAFVRKPVDLDQLRAAVSGVGCLRAQPPAEQRQANAGCRTEC
jgi:CheY-like chemotaxis protein